MAASDPVSRLHERWRPSARDYTLYWYNYSQPSRAVAQLLEEGAIPHKRVDISLPKKEQKDPLFIEIVNPAGLVPVLYFPDEKKFQAESNELLKLLVHKHRDKLNAWYPVDHANTTAYIDEQLVWIAERVRPIATGYLRACVVLKDAKMAKDNSEKVPQLLEDIETHFKQARDRYQAMSDKKEVPEVVYIAGTAHPTIADLQLVHELNSPHHLGVLPFDTLHQPLLTKWYQTFSERPLTKKLYSPLAWPIWFASGVLKVNQWFGKTTL